MGPQIQRWAERTDTEGIGGPEKETHADRLRRQQIQWHKNQAVSFSFEVNFCQPKWGLEKLLRCEGLKSALIFS